VPHKQVSGFNPGFKKNSKKMQRSTKIVKFLQLLSIMLSYSDEYDSEQYYAYDSEQCIHSTAASKAVSLLL
jgi:hypothetical protein